MSLPYVTLNYIAWHDMTLHTYLCISAYISCINIHWIDITFRKYGPSDAIIQWWYTNNLEQKGKVLQYYARGLMKNPKWPSKSMTMARMVWYIFIVTYIYIWVRYVNAILYICIICIYIYTHMWLFLVSSAMEFAGGSLRVGDPGYPSMNCAGWRPTGNHQKLTCHVVTLPHPNKKKYCASFSKIVRK